MKIAIVGSNWRPISESEKNVFAPGLVILDLANGLTEKGHEVTLFAPQKTVTKAKLISEGLNSVYEDYSDLLYNDLPTFLKIEQQYEMVLISKAFEMASKGEFDLIHVHKTNIEPYFSNFAKCPTLITSHNSYLVCKTPIFSKADGKRIEKYKKTCYYTALSNYIKNEIDLNFVGVVGNGVNLEEFRFNQTGGKALVCAGRLIQSKGPDIALDVAEQTDQEIQIIGDVRAGRKDRIFADHLFEKIKKMKKAQYLGFISHRKIASHFGGARALLMPVSEPEGFGLTAVEAMATGTPVIAYDLGALSEIIENGQNGYICPPGDKECLKKAVKEIYEMPQHKYLDMRKACRKRAVDHFSLEKMIAGYEAVYQKVIQDWQTKSDA